MFACPTSLKVASQNFQKNFASPIDNVKNVSRDSCSRSRSGEKEEHLSLVKASRLLASDLRRDSKDGKKLPKDEKSAKQKYSRKLSFERKGYDLTPTSSFMPNYSKLKDRFDKLLGKTSPGEVVKSKDRINRQDQSQFEQKLPNLSKYLTRTHEITPTYEKDDNDKNPLIKTLSIYNTPTKSCQNSDQYQLIPSLSPKKTLNNSTSYHRKNSYNDAECHDDSDFWGTGVNIMIEDCKEVFEEEITITDKSLKPLPMQPKDLENKAYNAELAKFPVLDLQENVFQNSLGNEKLNLVLDLDETLINSYTVSNDFNPKHLNKIQQRCAKEFSCRGSTILMIMRPYLFEFLERVSKYYNLYIYSHGRFEYVSCALDIIDKEEKYIKRNRVYKNFVEMNKNGQKMLENLIPDASEREKTLIIDDYCHIWKEDGKTICSKKFIPFANLLAQDKSNQYPLFKGKENKKGETFGWLCHSNRVSDFKYYSEGSNDSQTSQLEALAGFLESLAQTYNHVKLFNFSKVSVESIYKEKRRDVLKGLNVSIMSACSQRQRTFEEIAVLLGAENVKSRETQYLLLDACLDGTTKIKLINSLAENPSAKIVSIYWLVECYFLLKKVSIKDFYTGSSSRVSQ